MSFPRITSFLSQMRSIAYAEYAHSRICSETRTSRKILRLMQRMTNFPALNEICRNDKSGLLMQAAFCVRGLRLQASFACSFPLAFFSLRTIFLRLMQILIIFPAPECREQKLVLCEKSCALCRCR